MSESVAARSSAPAASAVPASSPARPRVGRGIPPPEDASAPFGTARRSGPLHLVPKDGLPWPPLSPSLRASMPPPLCLSWIKLGSASHAVGGAKPTVMVLLGLMTSSPSGGDAVHGRQILARFWPAALWLKSRRVGEASAREDHTRAQAHACMSWRPGDGGLPQRPLSQWLALAHVRERGRWLSPLPGALQRIRWENVVRIRCTRQGVRVCVRTNAPWQAPPWGRARRRRPPEFVPSARGRGVGVRYRTAVLS